jgi:hypothetical protein
MANFSKVAALVLGLGSLLGTALPTDLEVEVVSNIEAIDSPELPAAGCTATSYSDIASIVASCPISIIQGVTVPAGGQIKLSGLRGKTVSSPYTIMPTS